MTPRDQIIEVMARAIATRDGTKHVVLKEPLWKNYEKYAEAALTALESSGYIVRPREATESMGEALDDVLRCELGGLHDSAFWSDGWLTEIDTAMTEAWEKEQNE